MICVSFGIFFFERADSCSLVDYLEDIMWAGLDISLFLFEYFIIKVWDLLICIERPTRIKTPPLHIDNIMSLVLKIFILCNIENLQHIFFNQLGGVHLFQFFQLFKKPLIVIHEEKSIDLIFWSIYSTKIQPLYSIRYTIFYIASKFVLHCQKF